jgi:hypothetical protein
VRDLIATTSRLNSRAFRIPALVCCDCGKTLLADSTQYINIILTRLEAIEEQINAIEDHRESAIERSRSSIRN